MRYVLYVMFPSSYQPTTVHAQYVDNLSTLQGIIKEYSEDDDRLYFEIIPVTPTTTQG